ncbi:hypothetical protein BH10PSE17_BH10PSE17_01540 [soil metagenome]
MLGAVLLSLVGFGCDASAAQVVTPLPTAARSIEVAPVVRMNGRAIALSQFSVAQPIEAVLEFYRHTLGTRHVEPALAGHRVVAAMRGDVFVTVRLSAADQTHTTGLILESPTLPLDSIGRDNFAARWPIGSRVLSDLEFEDGARVSRIVVVDNEHSSELNVDSLRSLMRERAIQEQRDKAVVGVDGRVSRTLWFGGAGGEAIAVVSNKGERRMVVLNLVSTLESR